MSGLIDFLVNDKSGQIHDDCFLGAGLLCKVMPITSHMIEDLK